MNTIKVIVVLSKHKGNEFPYFSVTAEERTQSGRLVSCGCIHDEIEKAYPKQYTDLIQMHLADINGVPMYAVENGYYYLEIARGDKEGNYTFDTVAKHLRISKLKATQIKDFTLEEFTAFVEAQKPRWKQEADEIIAKYNLVVVES